MLIFGQQKTSGLFPTPVGMNRLEFSDLFTSLTVPHPRGDEPTALALPRQGWSCSPPPWG